MKLIVALDNYSWINHLSGTIMRSPSEYVVMVILKDTRPILKCSNLCEEAVYAQRRNDLFQVGKQLRLNKIINLGYENLYENPERLIMQLQLQILIGNVQTVYYQNNNFLGSIFSKIQVKEKYSFCVDLKKATNKTTLTNYEIDRKSELATLLVGAATVEDISHSSDIEYFIKVI